MSVHVHRTEGVTRFKGREGTNGAGAGMETRSGVGGKDGDMNGDGVGDGAGTGTRVRRTKERKIGTSTGAGTGGGGVSGTEFETRGRMQDENGDGSGEGKESSGGDGDGDEDGNEDGNENAIAKRGRQAKKRKKPHKSCRRHVGNGGDLDGKSKKRRQGRVGSEAANPDNLENSKDTGGETQDT